jgi:hypothetical protein
MTQNRIEPHYVLLLSIGGSLLCLLLMVVLFDPLPLLADIISVARIQWELPRAMDRWQVQGLPGYQINVQGAIPLLCFIDGELTVQEGKLVQVRMRENPFIPDSPLHPVDPIQWDRNGCPYQDLTVENMFERVESNVEKIGLFGAPLIVKFDDGVGYITEYHFGRSSRGGIFGYQLSECCTWFAYSDLTVPAP